MGFKKFVPNEVYRTVFDIDFKKLYEEGKRIILTDVDNTLASYDEIGPSEQLLVLHQQLHQMGFKLYLISNNNDLRLRKFSETFTNEGYIAKARKPLRRGFQRALKLINRPLTEVVVIGDQLMTDVYGAKKCGLDVILVRPIKKESEKWYTRFNRYLEAKIIKKIKKHNPEIYDKIIEVKEGNEFDD